jgi:tetratricopeptide (TPR) repeat protein
MPARPRAHVLETESELALRGTLPTGWVYRRIPDDYGIDAQVEIFQGERSTGLTFYVQLKASEVGSTARVSIDHLRYWKALGEPVLIVHFSAEDRRLHARWAHEHDPYAKSRRPIQSSSIRLQPNEELTPDRIDTLANDVVWFRRERDAAVERPIRLRLKIDDEVSPGLDEVALLVAVASKRPSLLAVDQDPDHRAVEVMLQRRSVTARSPARAKATTFHTDWDWLSDADIDLLAADIALVVATVLPRMGGLTLAGELIDLARESPLLRSFELALEVAAILARQGQSRTSLQICLPLHADADPNVRAVAEIYMGAALADTSSLEPNDLRQLLEVLVRRAHGEAAGPNPLEAGRVYFNCSQVAALLRDLEQATAFLDRAEELDPSYSERPYFWRERGGLLHAAGRWEQSARAYERAVEVGGAPELLLTLAADSALLAGQYQHASDLLGLVADGAHPLVRVERLAISALLELVGVSDQARSPAPNPSSVQPDEAIEHLARTDALDAGLWLRMLSAGHVPTEAVVAVAILVALSSRSIPSIWSAALLTAIRNRVDPALLADLLDVALVHVGDNNLLGVVNDLAQQPDTNGADQLLSRVRECVAERAGIPRTAPGLAMRFIATSSDDR